MSGTFSIILRTIDNIYSNLFDILCLNSEELSINNDFSRMSETELKCSRNRTYPNFSGYPWLWIQ